MKKTVFILFLFISCTEHNSISAEERFPDIRSISCINNPKGCPCYETPEKSSVSVFLNHAVSVQAQPGTYGLMSKIKYKEIYCYFPEKNLLKKDYEKVDETSFKNIAHDLMPLTTFIDSRVPVTQSTVKNFKKEFIGYFWPTYYHLAMEDLHPGPEVNILTPSGQIIGRASKSFLRWVVWEGSGVTKTGLKIRYAFQKNRFEKYDQKQWGLGAGYGYHIYPYRTIAVNYPGLCRRIQKWIPGCSREKAIGILLYIREVEERNVMINGVKHDGYFCATDTGAPYFIREDRIDIFVGTHGGGNPYLPKKLQGNWMIDAGIENIVPSDWSLWRKENDRVWCPYEQIPADPFHPKAEECKHDYHVRAAQKSLHLMIVLDENGKPVRCRKKIETD